MLTNIKQKGKKETQAKKHNKKNEGVILMYIIDTDDLSRIEKLIAEEKKRDKLSESQVQSCIVVWLDRHGIEYHPSFSGLKIKSFSQRRFMKSQGMKKGHPDLTIYSQVKNYGVLFLEVKTINGFLSKEQKEKLKKFSALGYACSVSKGYYDATYKILKYLKGEPVLWQEKDN